TVANALGRKCQNRFFDSSVCQLLKGFYIGDEYTATVSSYHQFMITRMHQHVIRGNVEHSVQQMPCRSAVKGNKCSGIKSTIKQLAVHGILDNDIGYGFGKVP